MLDLTKRPRRWRSWARRAHLLSGALLLVAAGFWACDDPAGPDIDAEGVIGFWAGEGGCWSIATNTESLHPTELPSEFRVVGLGVRFQANRRPDLVSFCPGKVVDLSSIQAVP